MHKVLHDALTTQGFVTFTDMLPQKITDDTALRKEYEVGVTVSGRAVSVCRSCVSEDIMDFVSSNFYICWPCFHLIYRNVSIDFVNNLGMKRKKIIQFMTQTFAKFSSTDYLSLMEYIVLWFSCKLVTGIQLCSARFQRRSVGALVYSFRAVSVPLGLWS